MIFGESAISNQSLLLSQPHNTIWAPSIAALSATTYVATWNELVSPGVGVGKAQAFSVSNQTITKLGGEFVISTAPTQNSPVVAGLSPTSFAIAWYDAAVNQGDVRGQLFNLTGAGISRQGSDMALNTKTAGVQHTPSMAALSSTTFVAVWQDSPPAEQGGPLRGQIFSTASGGLTPIGAEFAVSTSGVTHTMDAKIAALSPDRFVVVWTGSGDVQGQAFTTGPTGAQPLGAEFTVNTNTIDQQTAPSIAALTGTDFVVVWEDWSGLKGRPGFTTINGQAFTLADGSVAKMGTEFITHSVNLPSQRAPTVAALSNTSFVVLQQDGVDEITNYTFVIANGQPSFMNNSFRIGNHGSNDQFTPVAISGGDDVAMVVWVEKGLVGANANSGLQMWGFQVGGDVFRYFERLLRIDKDDPRTEARTVSLPDGSSIANPLFQAVNSMNKIAVDSAQYRLPDGDARFALRHLADSTTSVATLSYQFFTGKTPTSAGYDYLVNSSANTADLNDTYYLKFSQENRNINFAVNLGKLGDGAARFQRDYGTLTLSEATSKAYATIFGTTPDAAKVQTILDGPVVIEGQLRSRVDYFATYGLDGANGLGTKAAMVGFLMAEAIKADVGVYAAANTKFLDDLFDGFASYNVDILTAYGAKAPVGLVGVSAVADVAP